MSLSGQCKRILINKNVDIHPFNMSIRFKGECLYFLVVFEGVYEEVYQELGIKSYLHQYNLFECYEDIFE